MEIKVTLSVPAAAVLLVQDAVGLAQSTEQAWIGDEPRPYQLRYTLDSIDQLAAFTAKLKDIHSTLLEVSK